MTIKVTGKNIDLGESLREYALNRVESALDKYSGRSVSGQISVEKNTDGFFSHCAIHLESGLDLQSTGTGVDGYASVDSAMERLEKRLRRYKRRINDHGQGDAVAHQFESAGVDYIIDVEREAADADDTHDGEGAPAVIAESPVQVKAISVSDAVMQLDLAERSFLVFRNAAHGGINVVYRRADGNIGWIDTGGVTSAKS
ncbi:ribosome-associated translation inhibitor RaiA [Rhodomicrobium sp. Az07]|uniref:ribosome hibernation-promoting factor, HPF/YfiA family n=1 Tax=Rhodomicrobium sp. Az07 TaxID=2839034 RepID=UPI001BEBC947|nr:ribosome-associated translation inhibitor RaiA [Rhodomicrobium sp. Az07]MBT3070285.1 ribosome-associated translation inhibitor RaiA [Rhodomicrobium sp. Az07]